jgi:PAT family beta-lactamase induction signal transducer AmpG
MCQARNFLRLSAKPVNQGRMAGSNPNSRSPWFWIPTLYMAEGLPNALIASVAVVLYKNLGVANTAIAFYTGWLYLPWVIKPLWSPVVDILKTRRQWIWAMQFFLGAGFAAVALAIPAPHFFQLTLAFFWLLSFSSATHDIAADGFYMLATTEREQSLFVGIRTTFYRVATICAQGLLVILVGIIQTRTSLPTIPLQIEASPGAALLETVNPQNPNAGIGNRRGQFVLAEPGTIQINPQTRPKSEIQILLVAAKSWNVQNGFCPAETEPRPGTVSWWTRHVSQPLGGIFERCFGTKARYADDVVGDIGLACISLSQPPDREVVVIPFVKSGNVSIAEGARLVLNATNWNRPALVVFQLDPKLKGPLATVCELHSGNIPFSWSTAFALVAGIFLGFGFYHWFVLPKPPTDGLKNFTSPGDFLAEFFKTFGTFFQKPKIAAMLSFVLLYRLGEAQLLKMAQPFLLDPRDQGGLGLANEQLGLIYGTVGVAVFILGALLGGFAVARRGLKFWLWPMLLAIHLPDAVFIWLAYAQPENLFAIGAGVAVEQFGYGFGFTAFMLYLIRIARGEHQTAHYAICTGFMALGMMLPGMWSGWLQEHLGYPHFFVWVILTTIPSFLVALKIPLDSEFGKRNRAN